MLLGLVGFIGSGKGTVGDILVNEYGFVKEAFANPVKDACATIFGWHRDLLEGDTTESRAFREQPDAFWSKVMGRDYTPREALQKMGTEAGRNVFHNNLWVHALERRMERDKSYVITDCRFPNEMAMIREHGGLIVRVKRGDEPDWYNEALQVNTYFRGCQTMPTYKGIHYSEWAWVGYPIDVVICNDDTVEALRSSVRTLLDRSIKE